MIEQSDEDDHTTCQAICYGQIELRPQKRQVSYQTYISDRVQPVLEVLLLGQHRFCRLERS